MDINDFQKSIKFKKLNTCSRCKWSKVKNIDNSPTRLSECKKIEILVCGHEANLGGKFFTVLPYNRCSRWD